MKWITEVWWLEKDKVSKGMSQDFCFQNHKQLLNEAE